MAVKVLAIMFLQYKKGTGSELANAVRDSK